MMTWNQQMKKSNSLPEPVKKKRKGSKSFSKSWGGLKKVN